MNDIIKIISIIAMAIVCITALIIDAFVGLLVVIIIAFLIGDLFEND